MTTPETAVTLDRFAHSLPDKVLHCRELGHNWRPMVARFDESSGSFDRRLRCPSCRTVRIQVLSRYGGIVSNRYVYPDGYLAANVSEHPGNNRDVYRLESLTRALASLGAGEPSDPKVVPLHRRKAS